MKDDELRNRLRLLRVPEPSEAARGRALHRAMIAFEQRDSQPEKPVRKSLPWLWSGAVAALALAVVILVMQPIQLIIHRGDIGKLSLNESEVPSWNQRLLSQNNPQRLVSQNKALAVDERMPLAMEQRMLLSDQKELDGPRAGVIARPIALARPSSEVVFNPNSEVERSDLTKSPAREGVLSALTVSQDTPPHFRNSYRPAPSANSSPSPSEFGFQNRLGIREASDGLATELNGQIKAKLATGGVVGGAGGALGNANAAPFAAAAVAPVSTGNGYQNSYTGGATVPSGSVEASGATHDKPISAANISKSDALVVRDRSSVGGITPLLDPKIPPAVSLPDAYTQAVQALGAEAGKFHCTSASVRRAESHEGEWSFTFRSSTGETKYVSVFLDKKTKPRVSDQPLLP